MLSLVVRALIRAYQLLLSPLLPPRCRFLPTCSDYAIEAVGRHGALGGAWLAARRIARCHPWGGDGYDPVPDHLPRLLARRSGACCPAHSHRPAPGAD